MTARFIASTAVKTNQSPYLLCKLLDEYPNVYEAYLQRLYGGEDKQSGDFNARREATRENRIREAVTR